MIERREKSERIVVCGIRIGDESRFEADERLAELRRLVVTAGGQVVGELRQERDKATPNLFIGAGKVEELKQLVESSEADLVVFDHDLSPVQNRNLEEGVCVQVLDRTGLILDIFALHALSKTGKLQVELAQLQYLLPRLSGMWTHLSRQKGGIGLRGPGETQLEADRRRIRELISRIKGQLVKVRKTRELHRSRRDQAGLPVISLVGYTNAGKSTLFNALTKADVESADKLFATLDPTVRRRTLPDGRPVAFSDTVGFIRHLPPMLKQAFSATLEEVAKSSLILHVIDISHPDMERQVDVVNEVLREIEAHEIPILHVLNKVDRDINPHFIARVSRELSPAAPVSAKEGLGLDALLRDVGLMMLDERRVIRVYLTHEQGAVAARIHREAHILESHHDETGSLFLVEAAPALLAALAPYRSSRALPAPKTSRLQSS